MVENSCIKCAVHRDSDAVGTCSQCGRGFCSVCRSVVEGKPACSICAAKWLDIPVDEIKSGFVEGSSVPRNHDVTSRMAAVVLLLLSSITYIPMLANWDKSRSIFVGLLVLAIISFGFQAALIVRNNPWIWWTCFILWIVDMIVMDIVYFHSLEPSGGLSLIILCFFFPFVIGILVWINYRNETLMFASAAVGFALSMIIYAIMHVAFIDY
mgnify:CR=1 FL=1